LGDAYALQKHVKSIVLARMAVFFVDSHIAKDHMTNPLVPDELDLLHTLAPLDQHRRIIELGCGAAGLARKLLARFPGCELTALEVDARQHAKNLRDPLPGLHFIEAGAQAIPLATAAFDLALMLKSLHHVPLPQLDAALAEIHRVLKLGGLLYVSEPVFAGPLNEVMRLFHDEELVRAAALNAMQEAVASGAWQQVSETRFDVPVQFRDFADFEARMIGVTFADHRLDAATLQQVRAQFEQHLGADGARFVRPMRVNLLRKR
jgi:SAM-dependent methyltransferase